MPTKYIAVPVPLFKQILGYATLYVRNHTEVLLKNEDVIRQRDMLNVIIDAQDLLDLRLLMKTTPLFWRCKCKTIRPREDYDEGFTCSECLVNEKDAPSAKISDVIAWLVEGE